MTKYDEQWVMQRRNLNHGLAPLQSVLSTVGNPQNKLRCIHVAGTNGKGSTCNFIKDMLVASGYTVGMFTSPHLITHRDRIRINDTYISEETFAMYLHQQQQQIEQNHLGMFEIDTLIAFLWFYEQQVDYAIIECGVGGRLDSTNLIASPALCVVTSIGYDHTQILGHRIQQIAYEKAGIIKPHTKCVIGNIDCLSKRIVTLVAQRNKARYMFLKPIQIKKDNTFLFDEDVYTLQSQPLYQIHNASLALLALKALCIDIHTKAIHQALYSSHWLGRFEVVHQHPTVIIDGAHNPQGIEALCQSMTTLQKPIICVFSALKDKDVHAMTTKLQKYCDSLILCEFDNERRDTLQHMYVAGAIKEQDYQKAIQKAMEMCQNGTVIITGSLYFISVVRNFFIKIT